MWVRALVKKTTHDYAAKCGMLRAEMTTAFLLKQNMSRVTPFGGKIEGVIFEIKIYGCQELS